MHGPARAERARTLHAQLATKWTRKDRGVRCVDLPSGKKCFAVSCSCSCVRCVHIRNTQHRLRKVHLHLDILPVHPGDPGACTAVRRNDVLRPSRCVRRSIALRLYQDARGHTPCEMCARTPCTRRMLERRRPRGLEFAAATTAHQLSFDLFLLRVDLCHLTVPPPEPAPYKAVCAIMSWIMRGHSSLCTSQFPEPQELRRSSTMSRRLITDRILSSRI